MLQLLLLVSGLTGSLVLAAFVPHRHRTEFTRTTSSSQRQPLFIPRRSCALPRPSRQLVPAVNAYKKAPYGTGKDLVSLFDRAFVHGVPTTWEIERNEKNPGYLEANELLNSPYSYAIGAMTDGMTNLVPGMLGYGNDNLRSQRPVEDFLALLSKRDSKYICNEINSLIKNDGLVQIPRIPVEEIQQPNHHFLVVALTRSNEYETFFPRFYRLNSNGAFTTKQMLLPPVKLREGPFLTQMEFENELRNKYSFSQVCGVFQVPRVVKALIQSTHPPKYQLKLAKELIGLNSLLLDEVEKNFVASLPEEEDFLACDLHHILQNLKLELASIHSNIKATSKTADWRLLRAEIIEYYTIGAKFIMDLYDAPDRNAITSVVDRFAEKDWPRLRGIAVATKKILANN